MKKIYAVALILLMGCGGESDPEPVEEKLNYTITVSAGEGGSVDTLGGTYPEGTALTITATPDAEYLFDGWSGTEISTSNPLNVILTGNESVVANFVKKQYDLALSIEGEGTVEEVVTKAGKEYASGTEVELTAIPAEGWMFNGWTGDLETIDNPVSITIDEAKSVTANFIRKTYELTVNIEGEGTVDEQVVVAPSQYEFETQVELTANPAEGWEFSNWSGAVEGTDNPVTIEITDAKEVTAVFTRKIYDLNVSIEGEGTVAEEVVVAPSQYEFETELRLTAEPSQYWQFVGWSGDIESTDNPITFTIDKAYNLDATFEFIDTDGDGVTDELDQCPDTPSNTSVNEEGCAFLFIADNGVTIKASDFSQTGETYQLNGESYLVVDRTTLKSMAEDHENQDLSTVVTSKVSDMSYLFLEQGTFNQDISSWDVSNVTSMEGIFREARSFNIELLEWDVSKVENMAFMFWSARSFTKDISSWDVSSVTNMHGTFFNSSFNGDISKWDVSSVLYMPEMFMNANLFDQNISSWDVSSVINVRTMFLGALAFNQDISGWDVSSVNNMQAMFSGAESFNQDISSWDLKSSPDLTYMFQNATSFNQDLSSWCVPNALEEPTDFSSGASSWSLPKPIWGTCPLEDDTDGDGVVDYYDQCPNTPFGAVVDENGCAIVPPIYIAENGVTVKARDFAQVGDIWTIDGIEYTVVDETTLRQMVINDEDVTKIVTTFVTDMSRLFYNKTLFNQDIGSWDTSNVISMSETFAYAEIFNQDIGHWDTSSVVTTSLMFLRAYAFNQDIGGWDTSNINDMTAMFHIARLFNKPIGSWDVSNVSNMASLFDTAENFNQDISQWNVQNVQSMKRMFLSSPFNQDISSWNVSSVTNMIEMFAFNNNFNQDLSSWSVSQVTSCSGFNLYSNAAWTLPKPNFTNCNPN